MFCGMQMTCEGTFNNKKLQPKSWDKKEYPFEVFLLNIIISNLDMYMYALEIVSFEDYIPYTDFTVCKCAISMTFTTRGHTNLKNGANLQERKYEDVDQCEC